MYKLSICIPTYNGKTKLSYTLPAILEMTEKSDVQICISDNCSTDGTGDFVRKMAEKHTNIKYHKQLTNLGFARNYEDVLKMGDGGYCWLMGDDDLPKDFDLLYKKIINVFPKSSTLYLVNGNQNNHYSPLRNLASINLDNLVVKYGWIPTWISRYIISRDIAQTNNIASYAGAFPHVAWLFHLVDESKSKLYILDDVFVTESDIVTCSYTSRVYQYFVTDYYMLIKPYQDRFSKDNIRSYLKFSETRMVRFRTLCRLRVSNQFSLADIRKASSELSFFSFSFRAKSYFVALIPRFLFLLPYKLYRALKKNM